MGKEGEEGEVLERGKGLEDKVWDGNEVRERKERKKGKKVLVGLELRRKKEGGTWKDGRNIRRGKERKKWIWETKEREGGIVTTTSSPPPPPPPPTPH